MNARVTLKVAREGRYWVGVPDGHPGACLGSSVMELMQEAEVILPPDVVIDYVFTGVPVELSDDIHRYRELTTQRRELDRALSDLGTRMVERLGSVAGLTDDDCAAMLGISRYRVSQLRNALG